MTAVDADLIARLAHLVVDLHIGHDDESCEVYMPLALGKEVLAGLRAAQEYADAVRRPVQTRDSRGAWHAFNVTDAQDKLLAAFPGEATRG